MSGWNLELRAFVDLTDASTVFPFAIRTSPPVPPWPPGPVTLLGDAIHTMTPSRAIGLNTSLMDALLLRDLWLEARSGRLKVPEAVDRYQRAMLRYAAKVVAISLKRSNSTSPIHNPLWGPLVIRSQQAALRVANALPPVRRQIARAEMSIFDHPDHPAFHVASGATREAVAVPEPR